ncbi:CocE/NonD family hydrolase [Devosia aurantiaca]|uniref:CocE/NonD family hydrolase n=1 Tax=Devosia aurantiaca TaxID=2714858 RepID=UPI0022A76FE4|nr:CocE/NonD family hydrolase [Devosia aurantiaca]
MVRYFRSGSNSWHSANDWPIPGTQNRELFLSHSSLGMEASDDWSRTYVSDTLNPVPTVGGANFVPGLLLGRNSGPKEQKHIEGRDDVLIFTSQPLDTDLDITGLVQLSVWTASDAPAADWTARLCEVDSNGKSVGLVDGIYRQLQCSNEPSEVLVELGHISHLFAKGNRIRLQIASSNFPRFDRNPQSGVSPVLARPGDFRPARQTVVGGQSFPSKLVLPSISQTD